MRTWNKYLQRILYLFLKKNHILDENIPLKRRKTVNRQFVKDLAKVSVQLCSALINRFGYAALHFVIYCHAVGQGFDSLLCTKDSVAQVARATA